MFDDQVKIKTENSSGVDCCSDGNRYPYGTMLTINDDLVDELDVGNLAAGDVIKVHGYAFVDSKSEHSDKDSTSKSVNLQMTSIKVSREADDHAKQMYGGES